MARTTNTHVRAVIKVPADADLDRYISTATALVDHIVNNCEAASVLSAELLLEIETYLAAHYYALFDQKYRSKSTGRASATFQGQSGQGLSATDWGQQAIALDVSGCLAQIENLKDELKDQGLYGLHWLGKNTQEQTTYEERNPVPLS